MGHFCLPESMTHLSGKSASPTFLGNCFQVVAKAWTLRGYTWPPLGPGEPALAQMPPLLEELFCSCWSPKLAGCQPGAPVAAFATR